MYRVSVITASMQFTISCHTQCCSLWLTCSQRLQELSLGNILTQVACLNAILNILAGKKNIFFSCHVSIITMKLHYSHLISALFTLESTGCNTFEFLTPASVRRLRKCNEPTSTYEFDAGAPFTRSCQIVPSTVLHEVSRQL